MAEMREADDVRLSVHPRTKEKVLSSVSFLRTCRGPCFIGPGHHWRHGLCEARVYEAQGVTIAMDN